MQTNIDTSQSAAKPITARPVFILADDLTGACDSAAAFVGSATSVRVALDLPTFHCHVKNSARTEAILSLTTETRNLSQQHATEIIGQAIASLGKQPGAVLFKKVDSAARGNFAAETIAALNASEAVIAIVAPAFPQAGRTVAAGLLEIRDVSGQRATVNLRELFQDIDSKNIATVPVADAHILHRAIERAISYGVHYLICDSSEQTHLEQLAQAGCSIPAPILWTGSAGLARALAATHPSASARRQDLPEPRPGRTLLIVGTDHPVTTLQVASLRSKGVSQDRTIHLIDWAKVTPAAICATFAAEPTAALVLTGGETAAYVLRALRASSIRLAGELAPGIPWGIIEGGEADGLLVVTKSGGFGTHDALIQVLNLSTRSAHASA
jgi:uncharacterized protein YgbK (DUF1537 family)